MTTDVTGTLEHTEPFTNNYNLLQTGDSPIEENISGRNSELIRPVEEDIEEEGGTVFTKKFLASLTSLENPKGQETKSSITKDEKKKKNEELENSQIRKKKEDSPLIKGITTSESKAEESNDQSKIYQADVSSQDEKYDPKSDDRKEKAHPVNLKEKFVLKDNLTSHAAESITSKNRTSNFEHDFSKVDFPENKLSQIEVSKNKTNKKVNSPLLIW